MATPRARIVLDAADESGPAFASLRQRFAGVQGQVDGLASRFAGLGSTVATLFTGFGLGSLVTQLADGLDKFNDLSDATGASVESLSALEAVALRTGTSFDTIAATLVKFNQALNNADDPKIAETLRQVGLSARDLKAQDPALALLQTAQAFDTFAAGGAKARAEQLLFGRSLREVAPFLKDLAESGQLNATVTTAQAQAAEQFNRNLYAMQAAATQVGRDIANDVIPTLNAVGLGFGGAADQADRFSVAAKAVRVVVETLSVVGAYVVDTFQGVGRELGAILAQMAAVARFDLQGFNAISQALKEDNARAAKELDALVARILNAGSKVSGGLNLGGNFGDAVGNGPTLQDPGAKARVSEYDKYIDKLRQSILATRDLSAVEQARIDINKGLFGTLNAGAQQHLLAFAASADAVRALGQAEKDAAKLADEGRNFAEQFATAQEKMAARMAQADRLVAAGAISWTTYGRAATQGLQEAVDQMNKLMDGLPDLKPMLDNVSTFADEAARNIQDILGDTVLATMEGNASRLERIWGDMLKRLVAQAAAAELGKWLLGDAYGQKGGSLGGVFGGLVNWAKGLGGTQPASLSVGMDYVPRDNFPALLHRGERVVPAAQNKAGSLGAQITYAPVINVTSSVSPAQLEAMQARERVRFARMVAAT